MTLSPLLLDRIHQFFPTLSTQILAGWEADRVGSLRINTLRKGSLDRVLTEMREKGIEITAFPQIPDAYIFEKSDEYALKGTKVFYNGDIYLQSISSMLPALILDPQIRETILDVCAAPGGKTTQIAALTRDSSTIVALEKHQIRYEKLVHTIDLQGALSIQVRKTDALKYYEIHTTKQFDRILLDAPCSAEGRISMSREASYGFWSVEGVEKMAQLQRNLLTSSIPHLAPGGTLVYSTCTLSPEENELLITEILNHNPELSLVEIPSFGLASETRGVENPVGLHLHPDIHRTLRILPSRETEGFFIAKMRKKG